MSTPTIVVLVSVVPLTIAAFALLGISVTRRSRRAIDEAMRSYARITPYIDRLQADAEVSRREAERLEASLDELRTARAERAGRR